MHGESDLSALFRAEFRAEFGRFAASARPGDWAVILSEPSLAHVAIDPKVERTEFEAHAEGRKLVIQPVTRADQRLIEP